MGVNKKSISAQALMEMKNIKSAIKEESKDTLKALLSEAVKDVLRESIEEDDDMEIFDGDKKDDDCCEKCGKCGDECTCDKKDADGNEESKSEKSGDLEEAGQDDELAAQEDPNAAGAGVDPNAQAAAGDGEGMDAAMNAPVPGDGQEQDDFTAQYQAGDEDTLDLTGEQDIQNVLKVYKSLSNDDQVVVTKDGGKINLQDNGTGAEYIIDLGT